MPQANECQQREVYYRGMVQGVGFRYATLRIASRYDVNGYVRNLPDGRVQVVAEGTSQELDRFFGAICSQMGGFIHDAAQTIRPASGQFGHFDIRY